VTLERQIFHRWDTKIVNIERILIKYSSLNSRTSLHENLSLKRIINCEITKLKCLKPWEYLSDRSIFVYQDPSAI
jgi:hypothetical protein